MTKDNNKLGEFFLDGLPPMPRGQPQIDVSFDIDSNGILSVAAVEKSTGKANKIEIKNDKGRLSQEEIERMIDEAEKYKSQDESNKVRIEAKNSLENLVYQTKDMLSQDTVQDKLSDEDKDLINSKCTDVMSWAINENSEAEKNDFEEKEKEFQSVINPIIQKMQQMGNMPTASTPEQNFTKENDVDDGPKIEEID